MSTYDDYRLDEIIEAELRRTRERSRDCESVRSFGQQARPGERRISEQQIFDELCFRRVVLRYLGLDPTLPYELTAWAHVLAELQVDDSESDEFPEVIDLNHLEITDCTFFVELLGTEIKRIEIEEVREFLPTVDDRVEEYFDIDHPDAWID